MTIKISYECAVPFTGIRIPVERRLKPGKIIRVVKVGLDEGLRVWIERDMTLRVTTDENVSLGSADASQDSVGYEQQQINKKMVDPDYKEQLYARRRFADGVIRSKLGRKIEVTWEQTLPSQARK